MFSAEDEAKYLGYGAPSFIEPEPPRRRAPRRDEPEDDDDPISRYERKKPSSFQSFYMIAEAEEAPSSRMNQTVRSSDVVGRTLRDDDALLNDPIMKMEFLVPITRVEGGRTIVPCKAQSAAEALLFLSSQEGGAEISLSEVSKGELRLLVNRVDDFTQIDPLVVLTASVPVSPTCRIFFEEVISFSNYMLALVFNVRFCAVVTPKTKTPLIPLSDASVGVCARPYKGKDATRGQPFNIDDALNAVEELSGDIDLQVRAYMISLGQLTSRQVCDFEFIEEQRDVFKRITQGELKVVRHHKKKKGQ